MHFPPFSISLYFETTVAGKLFNPASQVHFCLAKIRRKIDVFIVYLILVPIIFSSFILDVSKICSLAFDSISQKFISEASDFFQLWTLHNQNWQNCTFFWHCQPLTFAMKVSYYELNMTISCGRFVSQLWKVVWT
jgi:hypothetical protein